MSEYRPEQRIVELEALPQNGWISARIHVGKINLLLDAMNTAPAFLKLTQVTFQDGHSLSFLALRRDAIQVIIPHEPSDQIVRQNPAETAVKRIGCFMPSGNIEGDLRLLPDIRVSDFLLKCKGFVLLNNSTADIWHENQAAVSGLFQQSPAALVNIEALLGVTEL